MQVIERGHVYRPAVRVLEGDRKQELDKTIHNQTIVFINKQPGQEHDGTTTQEVIRILLDRTRHCANCMPHRNNEQIIYHLRMALVLHEARALERKVEKGDIQPEYMEVGSDGHFELHERMTRQDIETDHLIPHRNDWDRPCNHPTINTEE